MALTGFETAGTLVQDILDRRMSADELLEALIARIERYNTTVNAVVARTLERARHRARDLDRAVGRNHAPGPLAGLPFTVKDSIEVAGLPTTSGSVSMMRHRAASHAPAVSRLIEAGANFFAKTNLPEFAGDYQTYNKLFGATRNPWDPEHTPGGSSGGSAAAVAAGLSPLDIGSDLAGSIRIPAHFCGIYGHKPSWGIVPTRGHVPPSPGYAGRADLAVLGPLARSAEDLTLALDVLAGPDIPDTKGWRLELPTARAERLQDLRVAYWFEDEDLPIDQEVLELLDHAIEALAMAGVGALKRATPVASMGEVRDAGRTLTEAIIGAGLPTSTYRRLGLTADTFAVFGASSRTRRSTARNLTSSHRDWLGADSQRHAVRMQCEAFFHDHDVLLLPVAPVPAPERKDRQSIAKRRIRINRDTHPSLVLGDWCTLASMAYLPATVAPIGRTKAGLPVGIQIVGPYLEDHTTIAAARFLADAVGGYEPPPGFQ